MALLDSIRTKIPLNSALEEAISTAFVQRTIPKRTALLREHQYCQHLYFLEQGTVRTFYYHEGKDISSWFYRSGMFLTSWYSFYGQTQSYEYIETLEDSVVYSIDYTQYQKLLEAFPLMERFGRLLAEEQMAFLDHFSKGYMFLTAKEKYQLLLSIFPDVELHVKLGHIASFLGISQETLSRIRARK